MFARLSLARRTARIAASRFHTAAVRSDASPFTMPALSPTMTEGGIARWEKKEGESFSAGDLLLQIETDKAQMDVEAQDDGVLAKILVPEGTQGVAVNSVIAIVAEEGDDISNIDVGALVSKNTEAVKEETAEAAPAPAATKAAPAAPAAPAATKAAESHKVEDRSAEGVLAPSAEFAVHANHIANVAEIKGTGPKGRVLKGDVLQFLKDGKAVISKERATTPAAAAPAAAAPAAKKPAAAPAAAAGSAAAETAFLVQSLESSVLRHLAEIELAKKSTTVQIPADKLSKVLKANKSLSLDAFALRAAALALHQVPLTKDANARVGVATDGSKAPSVFEIADASSTSVLDLAVAIKEAKKSGKPVTDMPAVVLAAEGLYTPQALPAGAAVVVVGKAHEVVSATDASAALDSALDELIGGTSSVTPAKKASGVSVIDVHVISEATAASAFANKIKAFLSNPELLTF
ncbi:pyridoxine biosynthesis protein [Coemansia sp. Benny D115]|nr:pyridoxine biosynthesis protein [Coemansia sp. Benny D115]